MTHAKTKSGIGACARIGGIFQIECFDQAGNLKWKDSAKNLVVKEGLNHLLNVVFHGTTPVSPWYVGLIADGPTLDADDTLASHTGWTEDTHYAANRKEFVEGAASSESISNSGNAAAFAINDTVVLAGAFICSVATTTTGTLFCAAVFTQGDRSVVSGDQVNVTYTLSAADDGV